MLMSLFGGYMTQHIGIVACSAEGAALCYRTICAEGPALMGEHNHPEISMHTFPLAQYMNPIYVDDWGTVARLMILSAEKLAASGANFAICPDNTIHQPFEKVREGSPIPWLHIAEVVGAEANRIGAERVGVLGTKYLMTGPVYPDALKKFSISVEIPCKDDREEIDRIIFKELVNGIFSESSRLFFNDVITKLKTHGCTAVVLGCTEIPLLVDPDDCPLPTLDSTRLLARAALRTAIEGDK